MNRTRKFSIGGLTVNLIEGDITQVKADALITAINPAGAWFGGIDRVIQSVARNMFHDQARAALPLRHLQTVVAKKRGQHSAQFGDVVFVIDDIDRRQPLGPVIIAALEGADEAGYKSVSMPAIRTGLALGQIEKDAAAAAREIASGIERFVGGGTSALKEMTIVIYNAKDVFDALAYDLERVRR